MLLRFNDVEASDWSEFEGVSQKDWPVILKDANAMMNKDKERLRIEVCSNSFMQGGGEWIDPRFPRKQASWKLLWEPMQVMPAQSLCPLLDQTLEWQ